MRLFVAAYPPADVCADLERCLAGLNVAAAAGRGVNARLAVRDNWHVTVAFLGEVADERQPDAAAAIGRAVDRWRVASDGPPELRVAGGGRFGRGRFTVLWAGLTGDLDPLRAVSRDVRRELKRVRLPCDDRPLKPHLTLARPGDRLDREAIDADRAALGAYAGPVWRVTEIELIRSHLGPKPRYDHLAAWHLS
jgi:RNA 2',3'-cyclic 3'-phosphodiesterase